MARRLTAVFLIACLLIGTCFGSRHINDLQRLIYERDVEKLQYFYNTNMDDASATFYAYGPGSTQFQNRVANVVGVFCPDPLFEGWYATGGVNGGIQMYAPFRDIISPNSVPANVSVASIYGGILPGLFGGSSQHMVGMPITTISVGADGSLYAELNCTLRQYVTLNLGNGKMPTDITGHYNNKYMLLETSTGTQWCMKKFQSFNDFSITTVPTATTVISDQNGNDSQLDAFVRPGVYPDN